MAKLFGQMLRDAGIDDEAKIDEIEQAVLAENKRYRNTNKTLREEIQSLKEELDSADGGVKLKDGQVAISKEDQAELEKWRGLGTFDDVKSKAEGFDGLKDENDTFRNAGLFREAAGDKYDENALKRFLPKGGLSKITVKDNGKDVTGFQVKDGDTTLSLDEWVRKVKAGELSFVNFTKAKGDGDDPEGNGDGDGSETEETEEQEQDGAGRTTQIHTGGRSTGKSTQTKTQKAKAWGDAADKAFGKTAQK